MKRPPATAPAVATAIVAAIALAVGACGIPTDAGPRVVRDKDVPFNLLDPATTSPPTSATVTTVRP